MRNAVAAQLGWNEGQFSTTDAESIGGLPVLFERAATLSFHAEPNAVMLVTLQSQ